MTYGVSGSSVLMTALSGHMPKQLSQEKQVPQDRQRRASKRALSSVRPCTTSAKVSTRRAKKVQAQPIEPGAIVELDVEIWPTSIVVSGGYRLALTIAGQDFARPEAQGLMKGSGIFLHDDPADRPSEVFGGVNTIHTGGDHASYLLMPLIPLR